MLFRVLGTACGRVVEQRRRGGLAAERRVVADVGPQTAGHAFAFGQHRNCGVVGVDPLGTEHVFGDLVDQRHQRRSTRTNPVGQRRNAEVDAFFGVDVALAVERQMRPVFVEQNLRQ